MSIVRLQNNLKDIISSNPFRKTISSGKVIIRSCLSHAWAKGWSLLGWTEGSAKISLVNKVFTSAKKDLPVEIKNLPQFPLPSFVQYLQSAHNEVLPSVSSKSSLQERNLQVDTIIGKCQNSFMWKNSFTALASQIETAPTLESLQQLSDSIDALPHRSQIFYSGLSGHLLYGLKQSMEVAYFRILDKEIQSLQTISEGNLQAKLQTILDALEKTPSWLVRWNLPQENFQKQARDFQINACNKALEKSTSFVMRNLEDSVGIFSYETPRFEPLQSVMLSNSAYVRLHLLEIDNFQMDLEKMDSLFHLLSSRHFQIPPQVIQEKERKLSILAPAKQSLLLLKAVQEVGISSFLSGSIPQSDITNLLAQLKADIRGNGHFKVTLSSCIPDLQKLLSEQILAEYEKEHQKLIRLTPVASVASAIEIMRGVHDFSLKIEKYKEDLEAVKERSQGYECSVYATLSTKIQNEKKLQILERGATFQIFERVRKGFEQRMQVLETGKQNLDVELLHVEAKMVDVKNLQSEIDAFKNDIESILSLFPPSESIENPFSVSGMKTSVNDLRQKNQIQAQVCQYHQKLKTFQQMLSQPSVVPILQSQTFLNYSQEAFATTRKGMNDVLFMEKELQSMQQLLQEIDPSFKGVSYFHYNAFMATQKTLEKVQKHLLNSFQNTFSLFQKRMEALEKKEETLEKEVMHVGNKIFEAQICVREMLDFQNDLALFLPSLPSGKPSSIQNLPVMLNSLLDKGKFQLHARHYHHEMVTFQTMIQQKDLEELLRSPTFVKYLENEIKKMKRMMEIVEKEEATLNKAPYFHYSSFMEKKKIIEQIYRNIHSFDLDTNIQLFLSFLTQVLPMVRLVQAENVSSKERKEPLSLTQKRDRKLQKQETKKAHFQFAEFRRK